jgi:hypothetical protein
MSRQTWRQDDRDGGGRLRAGQTAVPMVAMSTARWAWSDRAVPLLDGVGVWVSARWRSTIGGQGQFRSKGRGRGRRTGRGLGLPFSPQCQTKKDKEKSSPKCLAIQREIPSRSPSLFLVG